MEFNALAFSESFITFFIPFLFALCVHEWAHGWVAMKKGDNTAELMGRLTLNPIAHADIFGTIAMPLFFMATGTPIMFGYAKPVPVNPRNLSKPKEDMFWIAFAGPLSNIVLAFIGVMGLVLVVGFFREFEHFGLLRKAMHGFIGINLVLAFFNLIPVHPLDGGKILARFLPHNSNMWLEQNQMYLGPAVIMLVIMFGNTVFFPVRVATHIFISVGENLGTFF